MARVSGLRPPGDRAAGRPAAAEGLVAFLGRRRGRRAGSDGGPPESRGRRGGGGRGRPAAGGEAAAGEAASGEAGGEAGCHRLEAGGGGRHGSIGGHARDRFPDPAEPVEPTEPAEPAKPAEPAEPAEPAAGGAVGGHRGGGAGAVEFRGTGPGGARRQGRRRRR